MVRFAAKLVFFLVIRRPPRATQLRSSPAADEDKRQRHALHRVTHPDEEEGLWPGGFTMISRRQTEAVWDAIRALSADERPNQVRHAFDLVLLNLRQDNGEVMLTRDELADKIGCASDHVSRIMGTLERMGVIRRERRKIAGLRGPGIAVYFINPHVAWNGSLEVRRQEAREVAQPKLRLLQPTQAK